MAALTRAANPALDQASEVFNCVRGCGRTKMKKLVLSIALSALVSVAICGTTQAAYYHHRHHHYWHHGYPIAGYWNYYRTDWPGRGNNEALTR